MFVKYEGDEAVFLPQGPGTVHPGETVEVEDALAAGLLERDGWTKGRKGDLRDPDHLPEPVAEEAPGDLSGDEAQEGGSE